MEQWLCGTVILCGTAIDWYNNSVVHWLSGTAIAWDSLRMGQSSCGTVIVWYSDCVVQSTLLVRHMNKHLNTQNAQNALITLMYGNAWTCLFM